MTTNFGTSGLGGFIAADLAFDRRGRLIAAGQGNVLGSAYPTPFTVLRLRADGSLDRSFAGDGTLEPGFGSSVAVQADGSVIVAGTLGKGDPRADFGLRRFRPDGALDRSFGHRGTARVDLGYQDSISRVFVQPGGSLVAFGSSACRSTRCGFALSLAGLARFSPDGKLLRITRPRDAEGFGDVAENTRGGFVADGIMRIRRDGRIARRIHLGEDNPFHPFQIGEQHSGLIVGAECCAARPSVLRLQADDRTLDPSFADTQLPCEVRDLIVDAADRIVVSTGCGLIRINRDGGLDSSFGQAGRAEIPLGSSKSPLALDPDGHIAVSAWDDSSRRLRITRMLPDGSPDSAFASGGTALLPLRAPTIDTANAVALAPHGRVLAAGGFFCPALSCRGFALARYRPDGRLDRSFGGDGRVTVDRSWLRDARAVAVYPDGSAIVAGSTIEGAPPNPDAQTLFALARILPSGQLDQGFGDQGLAFAQPGLPSHGRGEPHGIALQRDRKIVVAGVADGCGSLCFTVMRFLPDGRQDPGFGDGGFVRLDIEGTNAPDTTAVLVQPDGRIVAVGGGYGGYVVVRLMPDGSLDRSFGGDGIVVTSNPFKAGQANALTRLGDGSLVVAGGSGRSKGLIIRYKPNGKVDRGFGRGGKVKIPALGISGIKRVPCGLVVSGTTSPRPGWSAFAVLGLSRDGKRRGRMRLPFGTHNDSFGNAVRATSSGRKVVAAGRIDQLPLSGDFALARYRSSALVPRCPG